MSLRKNRTRKIVDVGARHAVPLHSYCRGRSRPAPTSDRSMSCLYGVMFFFAFFLICFFYTAAQANDSFLEDFSEYTQGATIDGADYWKVFQGSAGNFFVQNNVTFQGRSQALEISGTRPIPQAGRSTIYYQNLSPLPVLYGNVSPTWVRLRLRPGYSMQTPAPPTSGIGAVTLDYTGKLLATDGGAWTDTGATYTTDRWYDVLLKLNFTAHTYDLYFFDSTVPSPDFVPVKTNLRFTDSTINSLTNVVLSGAYSVSQDANVYVDSLAVTYIYRLQVISLPQKIYIVRASNMITVQLQDFNANPQTAISEITLDLKTTSGSGRFSLAREPWVDVTQIVLPKFSQMMTFYYRDTSKGKPIISVSEYPEQGFVDALQEEEVVSEVAAFELQAATTQVAGVPFKVNIIAKDDAGNTDENYGGTVNLEITYVSPDSGTRKVAPLELSGFVRGVLETSFTYPDCGTITITAVDSESSLQRGTSQRIIFLPADFTVNADASQVSARPFVLTITARNAQGEPALNYNTAAKIYPVGVLPADVSGCVLSPQLLEGTLFTNGVARPDTSYNYYGTIKIRAEDTVDNTKQGLTSDIKFMPKGITAVVEYPVGRNFFYAGEPVSLTVKVVDNAGSPIPNYNGIISMSGSSSNLIVPLDYAFTAADAGTRKFSASTTEAGTYQVLIQAEKGLLKVDSPDIVVKDVYLEVIDTTSPIGTGEVIIQLVDEFGKVITSENQLPITVNTTEELDNKSAYVPGVAVPLKNGQAIIPITDSESEIVTINPSSPYLIKVKKGTVTFGPIGRSGINELLWRELKK